MIERCYTCNDKLLDYNKENIMILWNGELKILCTPCYKSYLSGIEIYQKNNPEWVRPKVKKDE